MVGDFIYKLVSCNVSSCTIFAQQKKMGQKVYCMSFALNCAQFGLAQKDTILRQVSTQSQAHLPPSQSLDVRMRMRAMIVQSQDAAIEGLNHEEFAPN